MRSEIIRRYIKVLTRLSIAVLLIAIVVWAMMQKPVESQEDILSQSTQVPLYLQPAGST